MNESPRVLLRDPSHGPRPDDSLQAARWKKAAAVQTVWDGELYGNLTSNSWARDRYRRKLLLQGVLELTYVNREDCFYSSQAPQQQSHRCRLTLEEASVVTRGDIGDIHSLWLLPRLLKFLFAPCLTVISPLVLRWCSVISVFKSLTLGQFIHNATNPGCLQRLAKTDHQC